MDWRCPLPSFSVRDDSLFRSVTCCWGPISGRAATFSPRNGGGAWFMLAPKIPYFQIETEEVSGKSAVQWCSGAAVLCILGCSSWFSPNVCPTLSQFLVEFHQTLSHFVHPRCRASFAAGHRDGWGACGCGRKNWNHKKSPRYWWQMPDWNNGSKPVLDFFNGCNGCLKQGFFRVQICITTMQSCLHVRRLQHGKHLWKSWK